MVNKIVETSKEANVEEKQLAAIEIIYEDYSKKDRIAKVLINGIDFTKYITDLAFSLSPDDLTTMVTLNMTVGSLKVSGDAEILPYINGISYELLAEFIRLLKVRASDNRLNPNDQLFREMKMDEFIYTLGSDEPVINEE